MVSSINENLQKLGNSGPDHLRGRRAAVVVFSHYPSDPRPRREAEALVQQGMEVDVVSIKQNDDDLDRETFNGVNIFRVPIKHQRGGKVAYIVQYLAFILASFFLLAFRSVTRRYNLVHVHNMPDILVFAALVPKICGAKVVLDLHDPMPELMMTIYGLKENSFGVRLLRLLEKLSVGFADLVLTPNISFAKLFAGRSCRLEKLCVIMNSPDENIFKYREQPLETSDERDDSRPFYIMYHGALVERHGLDIAVKALEILKNAAPNAQLKIYGRQTLFIDQVMKSVAVQGLQSSIQYFGGKSLEQIVAAIDDCDVGIIPNRRSSFTELNMPTRIFEYLSRGKPVIVPATAGIRDYFNEQEVVFLENDEAQELARKLQYVYSHPREAGAITKRGQTVYLANRWSEERVRFVNGMASLVQTH